MPNGEKQYTYEELTTALANAGRRARANPDDQRARKAAEHFAGMIDRQEYQERSKWYETGLQALGSGATLGLADELGAGVRAALIDPAIAAIVQDKRVTGIGGLGDYFKTMGERYDKALAEQREAIKVAREEDPYQFMAGELVGGLAQGALGTVGRMGKVAGAPAIQRAGQILPTAQQAARQLTTGQGIKEAMKVSAATGAAAGYGESEGDVLREMTRSGFSPETANKAMTAIKDATAGAAIGGIVGGVVPSGVAIGRRLTRSVKDAFKPQAALTETGKQDIREALARDIESGWITSEEEALETLRNTPGMGAADLGPQLGRVFKDIAKSGTVAGTQAKRDLIERNREQWSRVIPQMNRIVGTDKGYYKSLAEMKKKTEADSADAYERAYQKTIRITPEIQRFLNSKSGKKSLKRANEIREENDMAPINEKTLLLGQQRSMQDMDDVLQAMDDHVTQGFRGKKGSYRLGMARKNKRDAFRQMLFDQNDDFRIARETYGTQKSREEMMERGNKIFREDEEMLAEEFANMPQAERENYIIGMMGAVSRQMKFKPDDADILKGVFNIQGRREVMEAVLGDQRKFQDIMDFARNEEKMFDVFKDNVGNSDTAENLMRVQTEQAARLASMMTFGGTQSLMLAGMAGRGARMMGRRTGPDPFQEYMREQQRQMMMGGAEGLERAMQQPGGLLAPGAQPIPAAAAAGLMATGIPHQPDEYGGY